MKKITLLLLAIALNSCATNEFFQIYKTKPLSTNGSGPVYENADCRISYDFWAEGGDAGFTIYNKSSEPLTVHVDKSFYIVNGNAYDYYQARTFTTAKSETRSGYTSGYLYRLNLAYAGAVSSGYSTSYEERPEIIIPAKSAKSFREYKINLQFFAHCNLSKFPTKRRIKSVQFSSSDSPFVFSNSITYSVNGKQATAVHDFYVNEITNLPYKEEVRRVKADRCDDKITIQKHLNEAKENFYIEYANK